MTSSLTILLVEDDPDTRTNLCDILELDGHKVHIAGTAAQAEQQAIDHQIEVIILDRQLPDAMAEEILPKLRHTLPLAHVIVMTGFADLNSTIAAFRAGAADYILKPVNVDALRNSMEHFQHTRAVELELKQKREFSDRILRTADAIILVLDLQGNIVQFNDYFHRITGWTESELIGKDWFEHCIPDRERERIREVFIQTAVDMHSRGIVNPVLTHDGGERHIRWSNNTLTDAAGETNAVLAVGIDVTEQMKTEQQLLRSERLAGIGQTMTALAHESRNALQRINAGVAMMEEITAEDSEMHPDLMVVKRAATDLNSLLEEVRSFASPIHLHRERCDLVEVIQQAWKNTLIAAGDRDAELTMDLDASPCLVRADSFRIEQVFRNLFENSLAATNDPVVVSVTGVFTDTDCCFLIADNGPGLTHEQRQRVFEPFFTTKSKGTGLGMAIVKRILSAHGGTIDVVGEASENRGAQFSIRLPRGER